MENTFLSLIDDINACGNNQEKINRLIDDWEIEEDFDYIQLVQVVMSNIKKINIDILPLVIEALYIQNYRIKFLLGCVILESTVEELPFVTPLEVIPISVEKYMDFIPTLIDVASVENSISDCMYYILLDNDPYGDLLDDNQRDTLLDVLESTLEDIKYYIEVNEEPEAFVYNSLEVVFDVVSYINNDEIIDIVNDFQSCNLNEECKMFLIKCLACNEIDIKNELIDSVMDNRYLSRFINILENAGKLEILNDRFITQLMIATSDMYNWLIYPTELGENIGELNFVDIYTKNGINYYIFKFTASDGELAQNGEMIGISGGYEKDGITAQTTGYTFSMFEKFDDNYIESAKRIIDVLDEKYKNL